MSQSHSVQAIADFLGAHIVGADGVDANEIKISSIASLDKANPDQISFLESYKYIEALKTTTAGAVIVRQEQLPEYRGNSIMLVHPNPYLSYARISQLFDDCYQTTSENIIHPSAVIDTDSSIADNVNIGPNVVIEAGANIADGVVISANCYIGKSASIGKNSWLHPNVVVKHRVQIGEHCILHAGSVIGGDGFGLAMDENGHPLKIHQLGTVILGDYVEVGCNSTIDRGAIANTIIHDYVKIDNLVVIGHNCEIAKNTRIAAQAGMAGSTYLGENCILAGQVGIAGHLKIADNVALYGQAGVTKSIQHAGEYSSRPPLLEKKQWQKSAIAYRQLPAIQKQLKLLLKQNNNA